MEIAKYNQGESRGLALIGEALSSPLLKHAPEQSVTKVLAQSLAKAFADSGQKANESDIEYLVSVLPSEIKNNYPAMRIEEIPIAISRGVRKEFGDYYGLNVLSFSGFIRSYMESQERKNALKDRHAVREKPLPTQEEIIQGIKSTIINAYNTFLEKGSYEDYGNFIYDKMDKMGLVLLTRERKAKIFEEAKQILLVKKSPQTALNQSEFKTLSEEIEAINNPDSIMGKNLVKTEAKKLALIVVFNDLKEMETDIESYVNVTDKAF